MSRHDAEGVALCAMACPGSAAIAARHAASLRAIDVLCPAAFAACHVLQHDSKHQGLCMRAGCAPASVSVATASSISSILSCNAAGSDAHDVHLTPVAMSTAMCVW
eukprot:CAMPEP_0182573180 /NCGR_PEP_ID=MMETSP1324-20130603/18737_1 /TAXON_ID=236786 /ORGANISM="Florenciella sp., Strain RCC1587" /LENGTH=105 /DNA_ID=CAMNT_0024788249 /DNA_START=330 /DNA_END=644 /DNA_ORIENTATION=-